MFAHAKIIRRIYNWIDLDVFAPCDTQKAKEKFGFAGKKIILGVASSWSERKGLDKFFALADSLDRDEKIVLVGRMPHQALPENVLSVPETTDVKELAAYYNAADVFLTAFRRRDLRQGDRRSACLRNAGHYQQQNSKSRIGRCDMWNNACGDRLHFGRRGAQNGSAKRERTLHTSLYRTGKAFI